MARIFVATGVFGKPLPARNSGPQKCSPTTLQGPSEGVNVLRFHELNPALAAIFSGLIRVDYAGFAAPRSGL